MTGRRPTLPVEETRGAATDALVTVTASHYDWLVAMTAMTSRFQAECNKLERELRDLRKEYGTTTD